MGTPLFCAALMAALIAVYWPEPSNATVMAVVALLVVAEEDNVEATPGATVLNEVLLVVEF